MKLGIDIGSTTVKVVVFDNNNKIIYKDYSRHNADIMNVTLNMIKGAKHLLTSPFTTAVTGSAGLGLSKECNLSFVQEVYATQIAIKERVDNPDVVIELGGEDAKIIFLTNGVEYRMNGSCAGGTGAFIDQMATLLNIDLQSLNDLSLQSDKIYTIASRCGVFAKSDIQPLLNQGAKKTNIAASVYQAVVEQTIAGLAQGRNIEGRVVFLGGPLTFSEGLRKRFTETLKLTPDNAILPENSQYFVAIGAAIYSENEEEIDYDTLINKINNRKRTSDIKMDNKPLFENEEEYVAFKKRHADNNVDYIDIKNYSGNAYLGIDAGSTTTKLVLLDENDNILYNYYGENLGNPVNIVKNQLETIYKKIEENGNNVNIASSCVIGYGEDLIKAAFGIDYGLVETSAHYMAAHHFNKDVNFILDIGGQDIKCFRIKNNAIDNILLNEACSSGCGSFIQTYAKALGYTVEEFADLAIYAPNPIDLGSRCTVFMNSSIKQAQKEGVSVESISAGLCQSVVKNALYKVIRAHSADDLGENIVVQGGTFYNDAILRSFELELGRNVVRPAIAGLMGAYGAALYSKQNTKEKSSLISLEGIQNFVHESKSVTCKLCTNNCNLTINTFTGGAKYISGNRCERPIRGKKSNELPNLFKSKLDYINNLKEYKNDRVIAMPLGLNVIEMLPFWNTFFGELGVRLETSGVSTRKTYRRGQHTIPSDTVCYPAKVLHGHIEELLDKGYKDIFYPCMSYNFNENIGDNHYNCPVVAYYPELLKANITRLKETNYHNPYFGLHNKRFFTKKAYEYFGEILNVSRTDVKKAVKAAYKAQEEYKRFVITEGEKAIEYAGNNNKKIIVIVGRPYHIDPEINHGIDELITSYDMVLITEDCLAHREKRQKLNILNQWAYQSRMYNAAKVVCKNDNMNLIQLVNFGCGTDAITTDEVRDIMENRGKLYTQIKIDEINNLGAAKIRLRSLIAAIDAKEKYSEKRK